MYKVFLTLVIVLSCKFLVAQSPIDNIRGRLGALAGAGGGGGNTDTSKRKRTNTKLDTLGFEHRDDLADSIAVSFKFIDSTKRLNQDSSINDFDKYFSVPSNYLYLGNNGLAATPLIFKARLSAGFDPGFHAFDIYRFSIANTKMYRVTSPFTMLNYQIASGKEQMIHVLHTQNTRPNLNIGFEYKLVNAPGLFLSQLTNHNSIRFFSNYAGKRKRYNAQFAYINNVIKASENGGIKNVDDLSDPNKARRFLVPVVLGDSVQRQANPFQSNIITGNVQKERILFYRHGYDFGVKDSIMVNDSTKEYLFFPKLRMQHTLTVSSSKFTFADPFADSIVYKNQFGIQLPQRRDTFGKNEIWNIIQNDFSLIQFPETKNQNQFIAVGITHQNIKQKEAISNLNANNFIVHGEYRNTTRNKRWDMLLKAEFYLPGFYNAGDYVVQAKLATYLNKKLGNIELRFNNINRTPSFVFDARSAFNFSNTGSNSKKENTINFGATSYNKFCEVSVNNSFITNYAYFESAALPAQYSKVINITEASAAKKIRLYKNIFYYADATVQIVDNAAPIKLPLLYTRSRIAFEGSTFKNLRLSTGLEIRYFTPFKAYNYSPFGGQFMPQDNFTMRNKPDVAAFAHFRIKGFTGFLRAENLSTLSFSEGGRFVNNNFAAQGYATQGLVIRFGIRWWMVK
jgi:hypothetical protein